MATWAELEAAAPAIATDGRRLLYARGDGEALLATVRGDAPPRIHPVNVGIVGGSLYVFVGPSPKLTDLERDGRYALHTHQDPAHPDELALRGRATLVDEGARRAAVAAVWPFEPDGSYLLFELAIDAAVLGLRAADEWPPRYTRWVAEPA
jgi:dipeptidyl aminopeptidase/acylaminoacyl peptidase